jgi:hypothetical protein
MDLEQELGLRLCYEFRPDETGEDCTPTPTFDARRNRFFQPLIPVDWVRDFLCFETPDVKFRADGALHPANELEMVKAFVGKRIWSWTDYVDAHFRVVRSGPLEIQVAIAGKQARTNLSAEDGPAELRLG